MDLPSWDKVTVDFLVFMYYEEWKGILGQSPICILIINTSFQQGSHFYNTFPEKKNLIPNGNFIFLFCMVGPYTGACFHQPSTDRLEIPILWRTDTAMSCKVCPQCKTHFMSHSVHSMHCSFALLCDQPTAESYTVEMNNLVLCPL